jgi:hypothetical protein
MGKSKEKKQQTVLTEQPKQEQVAQPEFKPGSLGSLSPETKIAYCLQAPGKNVDGNDFESILTFNNETDMMLRLHYLIAEGAKKITVSIVERELNESPSSELPS